MYNIVKYESFENKLIIINNKPVLLAKDVANLYEVEVKYLNRMVSKYKHLFPEDYRFKLSKKEWDNLRCMENTSSSTQHGGTRYIPYVYTEKGLYMIATILSKNERAKEIHFHIIETFFKLRKISKNLQTIVTTDNEQQQKQLIKDSNELLNEVIEADIVEEKKLNTSVKKVKDEFEINLGVIKFKRTIENKD